MCQQLKHVFTCGCKPLDDDDATFFRFCARVAKASDLERVKCLARAMRAVKKGKAQVEEVKTKCPKCKKINAEKKNQRIESRHYVALEQFHKTRLTTFATMLSSDAKLAQPDQQAFVKDESRLLEFRLYNLTKKYWPRVPSKQLEKYSAPPSPPKVGEAKMPKLQPKLAMARKSVAEAGKTMASSSAITGRQVPKTTTLTWVKKKRKADESIEAAKPTKVAKVNDVDVKTSVNNEAEKKAWCVVM